MLRSELAKAFISAAFIGVAVLASATESGRAFEAPGTPRIVGGAQAVVVEPPAARAARAADCPIVSPNYAPGALRGRDDPPHRAAVATVSPQYPVALGCRDKAKEIGA